MSFLEYLKIALPQIWVGLLITFRVSFVCLLIGMALGFPVHWPGSMDQNGCAGW